MRNFIAIVFPDEPKAYDGFHALKQLHEQGMITMYESIVIERQPEGEIATKQTTERPLLHTGVGALLGGLIGLFGGPAGVLVGAGVGGTVGVVDDTVRGTIGDDYVQKIGKQLAPGMFAVLAEVHEIGAGPIDVRMAQLGGKVLRETRVDFVEELFEKRAQARRAELEQTQLAHATDKAQRMEAFFDADLHDARMSLRQIADAARSRLDEVKLELDDKIKALETQLAKVKPEARKELEQRLTEIRNDLGERERKLGRAVEIAQEALQSAGSSVV